MENITVFVALTGAAVVLQAGILAALYVTMRKSSARMEALAVELKTKALPALETAQEILIELRPKLVQKNARAGIHRKSPTPELPAHAKPLASALR